MSLNGLEDPKIVEAYEAIAAEPGSWFLVKYASRDEVELLSRGTGGIVEIRGAVEQYDETSPLYGVLKYRRRTVIVKFLPEDCSRLIQARVAVHFNAICERFSPYDTLFEISAASELRDTKLSAACSLHAASGSTASSTSSQPKKRLGEIAEEDEEEQRATKRQSLVTDAAGQRPQSPTPDGADPVTLNSDLAASPEQRNFSGPTTSELPTFVGAENRPISPSDGDSSRPELFTYSSYPYTKPKVKLGPRPSVDANGRPQSAGNFRPVSAIPAGFKLFGKGNKKGKDKDGNDASSPGEEISAISFAPEGDASLRPGSSSGFSSQLPPMAVPTTKQTITPEKARLMKAMKLREKKKKQMHMQSNTATSPVSESLSTEDAQAEGETTEGAVDESKTPEEPLAAKENTEERDAVDLSKSDSGIAVEDLSPSLAQSDSRPGSPIVASSEAEQSTKASSLSESTDETVQGKEEAITATREDGATPAGNVAATALSQSANEEMPTSTTTETAETPTPENAVEESVSRTADHLHIAEVQTQPGDQVHLGSTIQTTVDKDAEIVAEDDDSGEALASATDGASTAENEPREVGIPTSKFSTSITSPPVSPVASRNTDIQNFVAPSESIAKVDDAAEESSPISTVKAQVSTQDLLAAAKAAAQPTVVVAPVLEDSHIIVPEETVIDEPVNNGDDSDTETIPAKEEAPKRKALIEPIRTDIAQHSRQTSQTETHLSEDEDFLEELQSATVQEAKPMFVSKTPRTPNFPESANSAPPPSNAQMPHLVRTISNPVRGALIVPMDISQSSARSLSSGAAYLHKVTQQQPPGNLSAKSNVGSSISQRIKALEKLSTPSGEAPPAPASTGERPRSAFFSVKKREPSRSPSVMDRANSFRHQTPPSPSQSRESSPETTRLARRDSVASRLSMFESPPGAPRLGSSHDNTFDRSESISVTAKIIRDPSQSRTMETARDPSEYNRLDLKQSPLLVDHQRPTREPSPLPTEPAHEQKPGPHDDEKSRRSSMSIMRDFINEHRKPGASSTTDVAGVATDSRQTGNAFSHRLSISSRRSLSRDREGQLSPPAHQGSFGLGDDARSTNGDKKQSRTERFMRRLSNLSGSRTKASTPPALSPTVKEEEVPAIRPATTAGVTGPAIESYLGDVNVQFPDNLLWKRRNMCLDTQGFVILSALPAQNGRPAQGTKRYHLGDFRRPYVPDVEVQELPNSVVLDFLEGTGIQVACEDRAGQLNVLRILQDAHTRYTNV